MNETKNDLAWKELFEKHKIKLSILPVSRGRYIISTFDTFQGFDNNEVEIAKIVFLNYT